MSTVDITVPDLGEIKQAKVIEVLVHPGDQLEIDQPVLTLESDKASMEVPASHAGLVAAVHVEVGQMMKSGDPMLALEIAVEDTPKVDQIDTMLVPDLGGAKAKLIEWLVQLGDHVEVDQPVCTLESDKATMEVPSSIAGVIKDFHVTVGSDVHVDQPLIDMLVTNVVPNQVVEVQEEKIVPTTPISSQTKPFSFKKTDDVYAGPSVRKMAGLLEIDLTTIVGTGHKGRVTKKDLIAGIKQAIHQGGQSKPKREFPDPSEYGEVEVVPLSRIKQLSAEFLHDNWTRIPHVTQCIDVDITDFEAERKKMSAKYKPQGIRLTPLVFIMKALVMCFERHPEFNASLLSNGQDLCLKKHYHIGVAVDTPDGLVVPVLRDVDQKSIIELAEELVSLSMIAREGNLKAKQMQGQSFTLSSLGGIGGHYFTPIINAPDVAILGISQMKTQPVWAKEQWLAHQFLPLSLSYDHRVIDGAQAARFVVDLSQTLTKIHTLVSLT